jgi:hypothetical protein
MSRASFLEATIANIASFPSVDVRDNSDLSLELIRATSGESIGSDGESEASKASRWLSEISNNMDPAFIDDLATSFAKAIDRTNDNLKQVGGYVEDLVKQIADRRQKLIAADPFLVANLGKDLGTIVYEDYPFWKLDACGPKLPLINYVVETCEITNFDPTSALSRDIVIDKFQLKELKLGVNADIKVDPTVLADFISKVNTANKDLLASDIEITVKALMSYTALKSITNNVDANARDTNYDTACLNLLNTIGTYRGVCRRLDKSLNDFSLTAAQLAQFSKNLAYLEAVTDLAGFVVYWHRANTFGGTYLMRCGMVNPDVRAQAVKVGITDTDAAKYLAIKRNGRIISANGILLQAIIDNKVEVDSTSSAMDAQRLLRLNSALTIVNRESFQQIVSAWFKTGPIASRTLHIPNVDAYVAHKSNYMTDKAMPLEDVLYNVIINELYKGEFEGVLYERAGLAYVKMIASNPNADASVITAVNVGVYTELIAEFMYKKFMK